MKKGIFFLLLLFPFLLGYIFEILSLSNVKIEFTTLLSVKLISSWGRIISLGIAMILGIWFSIISDILSKHKKGTKVKIVSILKISFERREFWIALFISPVIFYSIFFSLESIPDTLLAIFFSFQNGFFWESTFEKINRIK